jgi:hypothetical protein
LRLVSRTSDRNVSPNGGNFAVVQSCAGPGHTVTFKNYCGFDIWIAEEGDAGAFSCSQRARRSAKL